MPLHSPIKKYIEYKKNLYKVYIPFFKAAKAETETLMIITNPFPKGLKDVYERLKKGKSKKKKELSSFYENYSSTVEKHNENVREILDSVDSFSYIDFLSRPLEYNEEKRKNIADVLSKIEQYKNIKNLEAVKYVDHARIIKDHYEEVVDQWTLFEEYKKLIRKIVEHPSFYCHSMSLEDKNKENDLLVRIKQIGDPYYDFEKIPRVVDAVRNHNNQYLKEHIEDKIFDNIDGKSLDGDQRKAILQDEDSSLVVAGAGSGKTLTICGKVKYLLSQGVKPEEILLLSYSRKSAEDLNAKVSQIKDGFEVGTFHKIGLEILKASTGKNYLVEDQFDAIMESFFSTHIKEDPKLMMEVLNYYALFLFGNVSDKKYDSTGELFEDLKSADFKTLKDLVSELSNDKANLETIKKEKVKSFEELAIANYYFINGVSYEYERPYEFDTSDEGHRQYVPDFYLTDYKIYHEHYGIDKNGRALQFSGEDEENYLNTMHWKEILHTAHQTTCIKTYSYNFKEEDIFKVIDAEWEKYGVIKKPLTSEEISNALDSIYLDRNFLSFITLIKSFISLYKARYDNVEGFDKLSIYSFSSRYQILRAKKFISICKKAYTYYMDYIRERNKIDFDDMILQSIKQLPKLDYFKYKYIIVDEFQDISYSRMMFLKSLIEHGGSKLFAVGDDWQAIYRFSGCDLDIFINFGNYFGFRAMNFIKKVYRNSQTLQDAVGRFVMKNKEQLVKNLVCAKGFLDNPIIGIPCSRKGRYKAFVSLIGKLYKKDSKSKLLVLGRNNSDINDILGPELYFDKNSKDQYNLISKLYPNLKMRFSTVHGSKGLEEDNVILLNADNARSCFPNKIEYDPLLGLVLSSKSD